MQGTYRFTETGTRSSPPGDEGRPRYPGPATGEERGLLGPADRRGEADRAVVRLHDRDLGGMSAQLAAGEAA
jgi:hypothetical protein